MDPNPNYEQPPELFQPLIGNQIPKPHRRLSCEPDDKICLCLPIVTAFHYMTVLTYIQTLVILMFILGFLRMDEIEK